MNNPLIGYKERAARMTPLGEIEWGDACRCRNYREIVGHGVVDIRSNDKEWIPLICFEDLQPYYAQEARKAVAEADVGIALVPLGRPNAIIEFRQTLEETYSRLPRWTNKKRQLKKAMTELHKTSSFDSSELPWRSSAIHLSAKYDGIVMRPDMEDEWYSMPQEWESDFEWIVLRNAQGKLLGAAYFAVSPDKGEWFWCGTVQSYEDPEPNEYAVGNVLLLMGMAEAHARGASMFNLGLDLFDYKPQMWGTIRRWDTGLEYLK